MFAPVIVALDFPGRAEAMALVDKLGSACSSYKVGLQLLTEEGPEVVRELVGTIERVDRGGSSKSRGMIITTSTLTRGAADEASALGFKVVEGTALAEELQKAR